MYVARLSLRNFRNYRDLSLELSPGVNAFVGANGQGKTNLLEALHVLATGRSQRGAKDQELILAGEDEMRVWARVERAQGPVEIDLQAGSVSGRRLQLNGLPQRRMADLVGRLAVVFFGPDDLQVLKGPPAGRRRFLDVLLSQVSPAYLHHLQRYSRALAQRNRLLRQIQGGRASGDELEAWDLPLVQSGAEITVRRVRALASLAPVAAEQHRRISGRLEELEVTYAPALPGIESAAQEGPAQVAQVLQQELRRRRGEELARAVTLVGPHRDDLSLRIGGKDARTFASQGQQRTAVLALKLAELSYMRAVLDEPPVLLLDDVVSELDPDRRRHLLRAVDGGVQTLITSTDPQDLALRAWEPGPRLFEVLAGQVRERKE